MPLRAMARWLALLSWFPMHSLWAMDLLQAYRGALLNDAQFAAAQAQHRAGLEQVVQRRAGLLPQLSLNAQSNWGTTEYEVATGSIEHHQQSRTYSVQLVQPLFRWQNWVQYQQGGQLTALAASRLNRAHQELILRVAEAYFAVLGARDVLEAVTQLQVAEAGQLASAKKHFELGNVSIADVHEAQASFDRTSAQAIKAASDLELAIHALVRIIGRQPGSLWVLRKSDVAFDPPQPDDVEAWIAAAGHNNPDVQAQELLLNIAHHEVRSRRAEHLPTLDLVASQNMQEHPNAGTERSESSSVGLRLSMPLYAGGRSSSAVREAKALHAQTRAELEDARRAATLAVRQAWQGIVAGMAQVRALDTARISARSALDANRLGYRIGVRSSIDVLEVQSRFAETVQQLSRARYDTLLAQLRLKAAVGDLGETDLQAINALLGPEPLRPSLAGGKL
ncbi:MAG: TolC family outer membrane protein [Spongiibacteraceae bacterium]|jgi:outer membrane protein|nr:TolC family outer membrane protein [Spongiibacteraceae bacterium]